MYTFCTLTTVTDELWNLQHPRPNPVKQYYLVQWEPEDFYTYPINGEWVLRKHRKTDNETKKYIRDKYWKEKYVLQHKQRKGKRSKE